MKAPINEDVVNSLITKYKSLGKDNTWIAFKLGIPVTEVHARWQALLVRASTLMSNGYADLEISFDNLCLQYQLIGESLKVIGAALGSLATKAELMQGDRFVGVPPDLIAEELLRDFIVLRRFVPPPAPKPASQVVREN